MPDRAIVPLVCGGSAGFLCGLIASVLEMSGGSAIVLAAVAGAFAAAAGAASTLGVPAQEHERRTVMAFRAALAAAFAVCLYFGMLTFLRDAQLIVAVLLFAFGGFFAYCLTQISVRRSTRLS
jgi:ABC-type nickel/cobalt efflux system permease component RcnA